MYGTNHETCYSAEFNLLANANLQVFTCGSHKQSEQTTQGIFIVNAVFDDRLICYK